MPCSCRRTTCPQKGKHPCHSNTCKEKGDHLCHQSVCGSIGKHPRTINGVDDATTDEAKIREWWEMWEDANVGIVVGKEAGLFVLDIDPRNDGDKTLSALEAKHSTLPETRTQDTGGGGFHFLFKYPDFAVKNDSKGEIGRGLDIKSDRGLIVAPPSLHVSGKRYRWRNGAAIVAAPAWLLTLLRDVSKKAKAKASEPVGDIIEDGTRKSTLLSLAGSMRRRGMNAVEIEAALMVVNQNRCNPPLDDDEVHEIATAVERYEPEDPISARRQAQVDDIQPDQDQPAEPSQSDPISVKTLLDNSLTLELWPADRERVKLKARSGNLTLHTDVISLDKAEDRKKFVKALGFNDEVMNGEVHKALLEMGDQLDKKPKPKTGEEKDVRRVISAELPDGRLIEQIHGAQFAVYNPSTRDVVYKPGVELEGVLYLPLNDPFILKGRLHLPAELVEYGDEKKLAEEVEACIRRYSHVSDRDTKISARYIFMSYIVDHLLEVLYLHSTGKPGSGKTRYVVTVGMMCQRPIIVIDPSAASLFRMMDAFKPTLIVDECNFERGSDDSNTLMKILNSGNQRIHEVPRIERGTDDQFVLRGYSAFGPKLIGSLTYSGSRAFESRCHPIESIKTNRKDIKFRMSKEMLNDFAVIRAKLTLWKLHNYHRDFEQFLDQAERELRASDRIDPRYVQISIPLYGLIEDQQLKHDYIRSLEARSGSEAEERRDTNDGKLITIIHGLLFETKKDEESGGEKVYWRGEITPGDLVIGTGTKHLMVDDITSRFNLGLRKKKQTRSNIVSRWLGQIGLNRKKVNVSEKDRDRSGVVYDPQKLAALFSDLNLPYPADFLSAQSAQEDLSHDSSMTYDARMEQNGKGEESGSRHTENPLSDGHLADVERIVRMKFRESKNGDNSEDKDASQKGAGSRCWGCDSPLDAWNYCARCDGEVPF
jgi:Bifunctional DNA primase/polymerase, N-terminal/Primase C terminal 1 (PriCT-1)